MWHVYLLLCSDGSLYTGISTCLQKRFRRHQAGTGGAYTRSHPPVRIVYSQPHPDKSSALKREAEIKSWTRRKKITSLGLHLKLRK
jgi:putative endonuclease